MATPDLLAAIVAATVTTVESRRRVRPERELDALASRRDPHGADFVSALAAADTVNVLAECKRRSPSRGVLKVEYDPVVHARSYVRGGAAAISVLTEPAFFDGDLEHLRAVREAVDVPLLRKDFIVDRYQLLEARVYGADAVLLIVSALDDPALRSLMREASDLGLAVLVEVHDVDELSRALDVGARLVGVNNRNLRTLEVDVRASDAVAARLPADVVAVSESGLRDASDIQRLRAAGYRAFLIGETLMTSDDPEHTLRNLRSAGAAAS